MQLGATLAASTWTEYLTTTIASAAAIDAFMAGGAIAHAATSAKTLIEQILLDTHAKVTQTPLRLVQLATQLRERIRAHAGPPGSMRLAPAESKATAPMAPGAWLDTDPPETTRQVPGPESRISLGIATWDIGRLGVLPPHAVICYERAHARISDWRRKESKAATEPPPPSLLHAVVHTDKVPTALANSGDHYWLPSLSRWASVDEVQRLFGLQTDSPIAHAMRDTDNMSPQQAIDALGRAVHVKSASRALRIALGNLAAKHALRSLRLGTACTGLDMFAAALDDLIEGPWTYVLASEWIGHVARALKAAYEDRGLTTDAIRTDARSLAATLHAPPVDLWVITPPCEPFSRRNHNRSAAEVLGALEDLDKMLNYARVHRPPAIIVENVDEPESQAAIAGALLSLPGYTWVHFASDAKEYGPMARARHFWVGDRE